MPGVLIMRRENTESKKEITIDGEVAFGKK
jgi:hypothetical protein